MRELRERTRSGHFKIYRRKPEPGQMDLEAEMTARDLDLFQSNALTYRRFFEIEQPIVESGEKIVFTRTNPLNAPFRANKKLADQWARDGKRYMHGSFIENMSPDWALVLAEGLDGRRGAARAALKKHSADPEAVSYLNATLSVLDGAEDLANRYVRAAERRGETQLAELLRRSPMQPAGSFHEALQTLRFVSSFLRLGTTAHLGFGRFDQYVWPYLKRDLENGVLTDEQAHELLAEFFISLNRDSDIYPGVQQGDNGQSLMLGGCDREGRSAINPLTRMALEVSCEVAMIDPKINLRVDSRTPEDILLLAARLTRRGLGFPQYCNDEQVIPGLVAFGYPLELARDYTVAACWEYVLPDGRDTPNIGVFSFPQAADEAIREGLVAGDTFDGILGRLRPAVHRQIEIFERHTVKVPRVYTPDLLFSACLTGCIEKGRDINYGAGSHYHIGMHGAGSSSAADALAAVRELVFERKLLTPQRLLAALESNFASDPEAREMLKANGPKVGNNDDRADQLMGLLFDLFADELARMGADARGGRCRPGTGSAQAYVVLTQPSHGGELKATADGRKTGDYISSSLSPAPGVRSRGVLSNLQTYGKLNYRKLCNGGPITMELADSWFADEEALAKTAQLIRNFVAAGCQQLQLNTLNPEKLRDAQKHPDNYRDLIVRVWGWSGYFVELSREYQDQIIQRQCFMS